MMRMRGFIRREGARRIRRGQREMTKTAATMRGRERKGRGAHPWRMHPTTTRYTALLSPKVLLLLTPNPPKTVMTKRGAWWEYFIYGYAQWDTWRPYPN